MDFQLKPGARSEVQRVVEEQLSATHLGSGKAHVLATPAMIALMEMAAMESVAPLLPEGYQTVGVRVDVTHTAPTPLGMRVTARAELIRVEGRTLTFRVTAEDEKEVVGEGTHQRAVIDVARFQKRLEAKGNGRGARSEG
jgi:predicted thioesterase